LRKERTPDILECWTILSALAPQTKKITFGTIVIAIPYRNPLLLAKIATTFDNMTGGRLVLGVGTGRSKDEFLGAGIPWENFQTRKERTKEVIEILERLWMENEVNYEGKYYKLIRSQLWPKPVQIPHPPIWLGGFGYKLMTSLLKYVEGWLPPSLTPEEYARRIPLVDASAVERGKPIEMALECYTSISSNYDLALERCDESIRAFTGQSAEHVARFGVPIRLTKKGEEVRLGMVIGAPEDCIERLEKYLKLGVKHFILHFFPTSLAPEEIKLYAEKVIPYLKGE